MNKGKEIKKGNESLEALLGETTVAEPKEVNLPQKRKYKGKVQGQVVKITPQAPEINRIFQEIDFNCAQLFKEISKVDESFDTAAQSFFALANEFGERSTHNKKCDQLSDDDIAALALTGGGLAVKGFGNLINAFTIQSNLRDLRAILKKEADTKLPTVTAVIGQLEQICDMHLTDFYNTLEPCSYYITSTELKDGQVFKQIKDPIIDSLDWLRNSLYHYQMALFLEKQYKNWQRGNSGDDKMPDYGDINRSIIYDFLYSDEAISTANNNIWNSIGKVQGFILSRDRKERLLPANILPLVLDNQLLAAYLANIPLNGNNSLSNINDENYKSCLKDALQANESYQEYASLNQEYSGISSKQTSRQWVVSINAILLTIISGIYLFNYFDKWYWATIATAFIFYISVRRAASVIENFGYLYEEKLKCLETYGKNCMNRLAGEQPYVNSINKLNEKFWKIVIFGVLGAIIGSFFLPPLGTIAGSLIGMALSDVEMTSYESDGSEYVDIKTGSGWLSFLILFGLIGWLGCLIWR